MILRRPISIRSLQPENTVDTFFRIRHLSIEELIEEAVVKGSSNLVDITTCRFVMTHESVVTIKQTVACVKVFGEPFCRTKRRHKRIDRPDARALVAIR